MTKRVLVVDDEPANLRMLRHVLSHKGYETAEAKDGLEALELLGQSRFDLVISDVRMPRMWTAWLSQGTLFPASRSLLFF